MRDVKTAIITAAGLGTRFLPVVKSVPKEMLSLIDKPIIQYLVEECVEAGMEKIIIVVRAGNGAIKSYFKDNADALKNFLKEMGKEERFIKVEKMLNLGNIEVIEQPAYLPYGNGSPIYAAKSLLEEGETFAMLWGDDVVLTPKGKGAMKQLVDYYKYENTECDSVMAVQELPAIECQRYGVIKSKTELTQTSGIFDYLVEKPAPGTEPSNMVSYGRQIISYDVFKYLQLDATGKDNELWLQDANAKLAKESEYHYKVIDGKWMTTGDPLRLFEAQIEYYLASEEYGEAAKKLFKNIAERL